MVASLLDSLKRAQEDVANAKVELDALCAAFKQAIGEHNVAFAKVQGERENEFKQ